MQKKMIKMAEHFLTQRANINVCMMLQATNLDETPLHAAYK